MRVWMKSPDESAREIGYGILGARLKDDPARSLFPDDVVTALAVASEDSDAEPFIEEQRFTQGVSPERAREFRLGRLCARHALGGLGLLPKAIPVGRDGSPRWPAGSLGSISHSHGLCGAAICRAGRYRGIGFDIASDLPLDAAIARAICAPAEVAWLGERTESERGYLAKILFSAKESVWKALSRDLIRPADLQQFEISLGLPDRTFRVRRLAGLKPSREARERIRGRFVHMPPWILTGVLVEPSAARRGSRASRPANP